MNQTQRKFIIKRLEQIKNIKLKEALKESSLEIKLLSNKDKYNLISKGKAKLVKSFDNDSYYSMNINSFFDFSGFEQLNSYDTNKKEKLENLIHNEFNKIQDKVMLGDDSEELIKIINSFENFEVKG